MSRTKKDTPQEKRLRSFITAVGDMRRLQKLSINSKDPATRNKFKIKAGAKERVVDNKLDKLAA